MQNSIKKKDISESQLIRIFKNIIWKKNVKKKKKEIFEARAN